MFSKILATLKSAAGLLLAAVPLGCPGHPARPGGWFCLSLVPRVFEPWRISRQQRLCLAKEQESLHNVFMQESTPVKMCRKKMAVCPSLPHQHTQLATAQISVCSEPSRGQGCLRGHAGASAEQGGLVFVSGSVRGLLYGEKTSACATEAAPWLSVYECVCERP